MNMIDDLEVEKPRIKKLVSAFQKNWVMTKPDIIEEKYRFKSMNFREFDTIDKSRILYRGKVSMDETFAFTEKYNNFDGRIITNESILYNEDQEEHILVEWDCGATYSSISKTLVEKLGLKSCGVEMTTSTTNTKLCNIYEITLILHDEIGIPMKVSDVSNIHDTGVDMLIGMNVIALGDFAISTYNEETCFSFRIPSQGLIDFTK